MMMKMKKLIIYGAVAVLLMFSGPAAADTLQKAIEGMKSSVERAALTREAKESLLRKAGDAVSAGIPADDVATIITRGLSRGLDSNVIEGLVDTVLDVKAKNLPVRPVLDRIEQGLSKGVPPERIFTVTKRLAEKLAGADGIVNSLIKSGLKAGKDTEREGAVQTVARALERSVSENVITLTGIKAKKGNYSLSFFDKAVATLTTLTENGVPADHALRLVNKAMDKDYSEKDMRDMEREILNDLRAGRRMDEVIKNMDSMMERRSFERDSRGLDREQMPGGQGMGGGGGSGAGMDGGSGWGR